MPVPLTARIDGAASMAAYMVADIEVIDAAAYEVYRRVPTAARDSRAHGTSSRSKVCD
jgi:hypothetical protein